QDGWFWYIPLPDDIVSVGVVGDVDRLITRRNGKPEQTLEEEIANCPSMPARVQNATRSSPVYVLSDFSYSSKRCAGEAWLLIGNVFRPGINDIFEPMSKSVPLPNSIPLESPPNPDSASVSSVSSVAEH